MHCMHAFALHCTALCTMPPPALPFCLFLWTLHFTSSSLFHFFTSLFHFSLVLTCTHFTSSFTFPSSLSLHFFLFLCCTFSYTSIYSFLFLFLHYILFMLTRHRHLSLHHRHISCALKPQTWRQHIYGAPRRRERARRASGGLQLRWSRVAPLAQASRRGARQQRSVAHWRAACALMFAQHHRRAASNQNSRFI